MQVVFHLGAPCTDGDMLIQSLLKNRLRLAQAGIAVPPPSRYRAVIRDTARTLKGEPANQAVQDALREAIIGDAQVDRLVLSDARFIAINRLVVQRAQIWPMVERASAYLRALFPGTQTEFFIGLRDPGTLIPDLFKSSRFSNFTEFTENMQPQALAWSEMLRRLQAAHPDAGITVWCNEDTPLLWGDVMRGMAGVAATADLDGTLDLAESIMARDGFDRMQAWLAEHPTSDATQQSRVLAAFLERYALPDEVTEELNLPGWTQKLMAELSANYDEDVDVIARMPGIRLITP